MYIRLSFEANQKVNKSDLKLLEQTLSDKVEFSDLYVKEDGKISSLNYWCEVSDPNDSKLKLMNDKGEPKYTLVKLSELVELSSTKEYIADFDLFISKHPELKIKLRGMPPSPQQNYQSVIQSIVHLQEKFEDALKSFDKQVEFNQKCDVHIANLGLLHINQVGLAEDLCTEKLQDILNMGWRIIACCVQPARRPDYIFGRYNPDNEQFTCEKL